MIFKTSIAILLDLSVSLQLSNSRFDSTRPPGLIADPGQVFQKKDTTLLVTCK